MSRARPLWPESPSTTDREPVYPSPAYQGEQEDCPRFRIIRVPPALHSCFRPLRGHFHGDHLTYCRLLVRTMACMGGRWHGANVTWYLEAAPHRARFNNFGLVAPWEPEAALRQ